jgi:hypothetical protein
MRIFSNKIDYAQSDSKKDPLKHNANEQITKK